MLLAAPDLTKAGFRHGFSLRAGQGQEFDFALLRTHRESAEAALAKELKFAPSKLYQATQVHGVRVVEAAGDRKALEKEEADALVARRGTQSAAAVRVADCIPILIGNRETGHAWAIHAGWRGVAQNIVGAALAAENGSALLCAVGPGIGACCFEVDEPVALQIAEASAPEVIVHKTTKAGVRKAWVNLRQAVRVQLKRLGTPGHQIAELGGCTVCDPEKYHSFRRDGDVSGRMIGVILPLD
jgi:polyphenol oxidase